MTTRPAEDQVHLIPLADIYCDDDFNCRGTVIPTDVMSLANSINEKGLLQPITIQPYSKIPDKKYRIVSGHRRYVAHRVNDADAIKCLIVYGLSEEDAWLLNFQENIERKDLNILQEARAISRFAAAGWTQQEIGRHINKAAAWVHARVALLKLPEEIQLEAAAGFLTQEHIKQLAQLKSKDLQYEAVRKIKNAKLLGDKRNIKVDTKKREALKKRVRTGPEMLEQQELIQDIMGNNLTTRFIAWARGEISTFEWYRDIREAANDLGILWEIPEEIMEEVGQV